MAKRQSFYNGCGESIVMDTPQVVTDTMWGRGIRLQRIEVGHNEGTDGHR